MIQKILDHFFNKREIVNCDRDIYLHRWFVVRTDPVGIYIHKFVRSDEDRALHDHPWSFIVIPIWRGYIEHSDKPCECWVCENHPLHWCRAGRIPVVRRVLPILGTRYRPATYRHRVELLKDSDTLGIELPSWSIFIRFTKFRDWGFWEMDGWKQWNAFWQEKCE